MGGRSLSDFQKFATENLKPVCSVANIDLCDDDKKTLINSLMAKSDDELDSEIKAAEEKLTEAEAEFKAEVEKLQKKYESLMQEKDEKEEAVKKSGLNLMKAVKKAKAASGGEL